MVTVVVARGNLDSRRGNAKCSRCAAARRKGSGETWEMVMGAFSPFPGMEALGMVCMPVEARMTLLLVLSQLIRYRRRRLQLVDRSHSDPGTSVVG
jgi:hypothetical protein